MALRLYLLLPLSPPLNSGWVDFFRVWFFLYRPIFVFSPHSLTLRLVKSPEDRERWKAYLENYHYLGFRRPFGAHLGYFIVSEAQQRELGCFVFTASAAWAPAPRDKWIGWDDSVRVARMRWLSVLPAILANAFCRWGGKRVDILLVTKVGSKKRRIPGYTLRLHVGLDGGGNSMLVKRTSKNQITIPKDVMRHFSDVEHFEVLAEEDRIILVPLRRSRAAEVREQLARLGIVEDDIQDAVAWARRK